MCKLLVSFTVCWQSAKTILRGSYSQYVLVRTLIAQDADCQMAQVDGVKFHKIHDHSLGIIVRVSITLKAHDMQSALSTQRQRL